MKNATRFRSAALAGLLFLGAATASAQMSADVRFAPGTSGATVSGTIIGRDYFDYRLGARAGQTMTADLSVAGTNGNGTVYFNILPPGSDDVAIYIGSTEGNSATVTLPEDGTYTIRTYLMGNDRDAGATVGYTIDISIR